MSGDEVTQASIDSISKINAVIEFWIGEIAPNADKLSPLYGAPFLIKDLAITMNGKRNELGSQLAQGMIINDDSTLIPLYKKAGLAILDRTTIPEFAISTTTEARFTGLTLNPWNPDFNAGGSTGGSAAVNGLFGLATSLAIHFKMKYGVVY